MRHSDRPWMLRRQVSSIFLLCVWSLVSAQIRYSIPEELKHGAFVGKIASDLGLSTEELSNRRFRIVSDAQTQYLDVNLNNGVLFVNQRIDREQLCGESLPCLLPLEVVIENPVEQYRVEVEVLDINDNSPSFPRNEIILEIAESATAGARFLLESAHDPDVGTNSIRTYQLSPNDHFVLDVQTRGEWILAELILEKPMDRETQSKHQLLLQAFDGGTPERTGTARISIIVLDANDNAPVFERSLYSVSLTEDVPFGTLVIKLNATDLDEGSNGEVVYSFSSYNKERIPELFSIDRKSGEIRVKGILDFEEASFYEISVEARDKGPHPLPAHCTVRVDIKDVNDNTPELALNSVSSTISENAQTGTLVALISVTDRDSNENGNTDCQISPNLPFELKSSFKNSYRLLTNDLLDRENTPEYQVTVTCTDQGSPRLSTKETIAVHISDINDNAPSFPQTSYTVYVTENNAPGTLIGSVTALDPDTEQNSHLTYSVLDTQIEGMPITSYVSINPETGDIYSQHSYDYEQLKHFRIHIQAQDVGPPLLWGNATVNIVILDQNDNTPAIISPKTVKDSQISVPRSAGAGYLATKITATDADSGQNARLFYQLLQATDPSLFTVSHNLGEVKTARRFEDKDSAIQRLVIQVKDRGHPPLSATATVTLTIVEHIGDLSSDFRETHTIPEHSSNLAFYIIISLGAISSILLVVIIALVITICPHNRHHAYGRTWPPINCCCVRELNSNGRLQNSNVTLQIDSKFMTNSVEVRGNGSLSDTYRYKVRSAPEPNKMEFMFVTPYSPTASGSIKRVPKAYLSEQSAPTTNNWPNRQSEVGQLNTDWRSSEPYIASKISSQYLEENLAQDEIKREFNRRHTAITSAADAGYIEASPDLEDGIPTWAPRYGSQQLEHQEPDEYQPSIYMGGSPVRLPAKQDQVAKLDGQQSASSTKKKKKRSKRTEKRESKVTVEEPQNE
uniref:Protocadherin mu5 n=1 Tax=Callorhinchus milii TaxID=7868 RepID=B0YN81_CALMI|nr:protocadherin mu5 [Callorhinchus milii]